MGRIIWCAVYVQKTDNNSLLFFFVTKDGGKNIYDKSILIETNTNDNKIDVENNDKCEIFIPTSRRFIVLNNITKNSINYIGFMDVKNKMKLVSENLNNHSI